MGFNPLEQGGDAKGLSGGWARWRLKDRGEEQNERARRVRVGLTGLAAIIVLVMLATGLFALNSKPSRSPAEAITGGTPLADMGLAPGASDNRVTAAGNSVAADPGLRPAPVDGTDKAKH